MSSTACLTAKNLSVHLGNKRILTAVDFELRQGEILAVLGSNGAGKTTLFRTIMNFIQPSGGSVRIDGQDVFQITRKELSKRIAYVPQSNNCTFPYSVLDIVTMGRHCHTEGLREPKKKDVDLAFRTLEKLNIAHLAGRKVRSLSGGEKQLVLIARALAQQPKIMVMDEPTASLDFHNALMVLQEILRLKKENISVLVTTHSARQAKVFADRILMIKRGKVFRCGDVSILEDRETVHALYSIDMDAVDEERLLSYIQKTI